MFEDSATWKLDSFGVLIYVFCCHYLSIVIWLIFVFLSRAVFVAVYLSFNVMLNILKIIYLTIQRKSTIPSLNVSQLKKTVFFMNYSRIIVLIQRPGLRFTFQVLSVPLHN